MKEVDQADGPFLYSFNMNFFGHLQKMIDFVFGRALNSPSLIKV